MSREQLECPTQKVVPFVCFIAAALTTTLGIWIGNLNRHHPNYGVIIGACVFGVCLLWSGIRYWTNRISLNQTHLFYRGFFTSRKVTLADMQKVELKKNLNGQVFLKIITGEGGMMETLNLNITGYQNMQPLCERLFRNVNSADSEAISSAD